MSRNKIKKTKKMAQEMYKNDSLLHLLLAVAVADRTGDDLVTSIEDEYYEKVKKAEGITISFVEINDKLKELMPKIGRDGITNEALKATNGCGREWRTKVYGYMWRMALKSGEHTSVGETNVSPKEYAILKKAKAYFGITEEEDAKCISLTKV
jgi:hypothetical protein